MFWGGTFDSGWISRPPRCLSRWCETPAWHLVLLSGPALPPIFVMPVGVALTSGLSGPGRLLTFPAPRWPAGRYFLCQRYCPRQFSGFFFLGVPLGSGGPAGDPVFLRAFLTPGLLFLGGFATAPAESECLGGLEFFPLPGPSPFFALLDGQRDPVLFGSLR